MNHLLRGVADKYSMLCLIAADQDPVKLGPARGRSAGKLVAQIRRTPPTQKAMVADCWDKIRRL